MALNPDTPPIDPAWPAWQRAAARLAGAEWFQNTIIGVIVINALLIGVATYPEVRDGHLDQLLAIDRVFIGIFVVELVVRIAAVGFNLKRFFSAGWNVFDFIAVAVCFIPGMGTNSTLLRMARLMRVARLVRLLPDVHVLIDGLRRAIPPAASLMGLTLLLCYLYGIVGWAIFHEGDPEHWGTAGEAMLTLFTLLTLEGWNEIMSDAREVTPWALPFILSFIVVGTFVVLNLVIGIVITSLDEAHKQARAAQGDAGPTDEQLLQEARDALDRLGERIS